MFLSNTFVFYYLLGIFLFQFIILVPLQLLFVYFILSRYSKQIKNFYGDVYGLKNADFISKKSFSRVNKIFSSEYFFILFMLIIEPLQYPELFLSTSQEQQIPYFASLILLFGIILLSIAFYLVFYFKSKKKLSFNKNDLVVVREFINNWFENKNNVLMFPSNEQNYKFIKKFLKIQHRQFKTLNYARNSLGLPNKNLEQYNDEELWKYSKLFSLYLYNCYVICWRYRKRLSEAEMNDIKFIIVNNFLSKTV